MGKLARFGSDRIEMIRQGCCVNTKAHATHPLTFSVEVSPDKYSETWGQGISMLHNPNALHCLDPIYFPNIDHHFLENGQIVCRTYNKFIPFNSITIVSLK